MGHKYVKENETFNTSRNGTVPKPSSADVSNNKVLRADGTWVAQSGGGGGASAMSDLTDVNISSLTDEQMLQYDSATSKWVNVDPPASSSSIETLTDVDLDNLSDGQMLQYNNSSSKWVNVNPPVTGVSDVEVNGTSVVDENGNAEIVSYKEVTQAEYNPMPDSKLTDGVLYCIKDAPSGPDGFPPLIYDTVEREVGVWTDGKPLYEKTISFGAIAANTINYQLDCSILTVDNLIDMNCMTYSGNTFIKLPLALFQQGSTYYDYGINIQGFDKTTGKVRIDTGVSRSISGGYITIQYTKTTDTPGSGTWTKQGVLTHHYSTSEQIIGTWIDGKPIYEKSYLYENSSGSSSSSEIVIVNDFGVDKQCIPGGLQGMFYNLSSGANYPVPWADCNGSSGNSTGLWVDDGKIKLRIRNDSYSNNYKLRIIARYTKTTD